MHMGKVLGRLEMADNCEFQSVELDEAVNIWHELVRSMEGDMGWDSRPILLLGRLGMANDSR